MKKLDNNNIDEFNYQKIYDDLNEIIRKKNEEIDVLKKSIANTESELNNVYSSRSWQITQILRKIKSLFNRLTFKKQYFHSRTLKNNDNNYNNFVPYDSEYQNNMDYSKLKTDIKTIAFYLPQFHTFKENDEWWGEGFTEWTNTKKAKPRFEGHYQPRTPHKDIGYYDLNDFNVMKNQIELAKQHGIFGFCFYYYWFSGKRLMEKPVDMLLKNVDVDFPFCLCWANENWTRTWDGLEKDVLIAQKYSKSDYKKFIVDIKKYLEDKRYIRIDGKPLILIYNPYEIPNLQEQISEWRKYAREIGIGEIYIMTRNNLADIEFERAGYVDAEFDFSPLGLGHPETVMNGLPFKRVINYSKLIKEIKHLYEEHSPIKPFYYSCMMGWDNSPRRKDGGALYNVYSLHSFYDWLDTIVKYTRKRHPVDRRFIFINAWNEWAEGTYLEPDEKYGYANINTLSKAIFDLPFNNDVKFTLNTVKSNNLNEKIAVQIHLYYVELIDEIISQLKNIPYAFDAYITTDTLLKKKEIEKAFKKVFINKKIVVEQFINRGRDVAPFIIQMTNLIDCYDYICHIHTKKSTNVEYGDRWRNYLYYNLFGSKENVIGIFNIFKENNIGLISPPPFPEIANLISFGSNKNNMIILAKKMKINEKIREQIIDFPSGTMFWAKTDAIKPLFDLRLTTNDFEEENGQLDGTLAHSIERIFGYLIKSRGYNYAKVLNRTQDLKKGAVPWYHS